MKTTALTPFGLLLLAACTNDPGVRYHNYTVDNRTNTVRGYYEYEASDDIDEVEMDDNEIEIED